MSILCVQDSYEFNQFLENEKCGFEEKYSRKVCYNVTRDSFNILAVLGIGSFGKVVLMQEKETKEYYATKIFIKQFSVKAKQDNSYLYLVMPFIAGGELYAYMQSTGAFLEGTARFYMAQLILGLEYLHTLGLIFRDMKPENVVIDINGYIKITDFGLCKQVSGRTYTLCGTPEYIAPEIFLNKGYGKAVDYWSVGVLLFEMCSGYPPFFAFELMQLYERIAAGKFRIPKNFSRELRNLVKGFLQTDPTKRIGNLKDGVKEIKFHPWFKDTNWLAILNCTAPAPYIPTVTGPEDTSNFDPGVEIELDFPVSNSAEYEQHFQSF